MDYSLPIKRGRDRPKSSVRSGRPGRLLKYGFAQPSSPFTQNKLAFDSAVAESKPAAAKPESSPPVIPLRVATPKIKLILSISNQSSVSSSINPIVEQASLNPIVPPPYPAPPNFAGYRPLNTCYSELYSFRDLANIIVPNSQKAIAVSPGKVKDCLFIKIENNDNPFPLLSNDKPSPSSIKKGKRVLKHNLQNYFHPSTSPFTVPTQKGYSPNSRDNDPKNLLPLAQIQCRRTKQGSSTQKDRVNFESLNEVKKGPGTYNHWFQGKQKLLAIVIKTLIIPKALAVGTYLIATDVLVTVSKLYAEAFKAKDKKRLEKHCGTLRDLLVEYDAKRATLKVISSIDLLLRG
ncbi:hypothetical protein BOTCAL_1009g00010 [Botryotinia calthae]|uniref:Uncharacterized protein n=1 Tax=Botryotinia calthae TaxID=38488 RepID=A0A4Y8CE91_9HELO|nr:hypothetical protein BOTCAL_1009g00010 [Botryotinia calthae]